MLLFVAAILFVLWIAGLVTGTLLGGLIHFLLVISIAVTLIRVIRAGGSAR